MSMDDNNDHMTGVDEEFDTGKDFEDFEGGKTSLGDVWNKNPLVKVGVVLAAIALIVGAIMMFGGKEKVIDPSAIRTGGASNVKQAPGEDVSPAYKEAIDDFNKQNIENATRTGESALPVPVGAAKGRLDTADDEVSSEDPLERWRRIQEERLRKERETAAGTAQPVDNTDPYAEDKRALAESMASQMEGVLGRLEIKGSQKIDIAGDDYLKARAEAAKEAEAAEAAAAAAAQTAQTEEEEESVREILQEAGSIEYARLITEANTDAPGPILAELASGPLAGSRLIGTFQSTDEYITLNFTNVVVDGVPISTTAIALDPKTANPGMLTDKDNKYFQRIVIPAAASFIEGLGSAIADSGSTTVNVEGGSVVTSTSDLDTKQELFKGVERAMEKTGEVLERDSASIRPRLVVAAGTPIGVMFSTNVERDVPASRSAVSTATANR